MKNVLIFFILGINILVNCKEVNEDITITIHYGQDKQNIGNKNGMLVFISKYNDTSNIFDLNDIEEKSYFTVNTTYTNTSNIYPLRCRLWKYRQMMYLLCNIEISSSDENIEVRKKHTFEYKGYNVIIDFYAYNLQIHRYEGNIPFLYNLKEETINVEESQQTINFEFKVDSYNNEPLFYLDSILYMMKIDNCKMESKTLKCEILKKNFDVVAKENNNIYIVYLAFFHGGLGMFQFVNPININYPNIAKEDIYLSLENIKENIVDSGTFITFETNIRTFPKIKTKFFPITLWKEENSCDFIKHENSDSLYMVCRTDYTNGNFTIGEIKQYILNDIHYQYNFIIQPKNLDVNISILNKLGSSLIKVYPDTLDFTSEDSLDLYINRDSGIDDRINFNIRLNKDGSDLNCVILEYGKKCTVPKSHFLGKKGGYYYIYHKDSLGNYLAYYENFGVKVILGGEDDTDNSGKIVKLSLTIFALFSLLFI